MGSGKVFEFDGFRLDADNRLLSRAGEGLPLPARAFDTLLVLVQHPGQLVTKSDLLNVVWAHSFVEESNLTVAISTLRRTLGEDPQDRKFIQTVSGRGYRFISDVHVSDRAAAPGRTALAEAAADPVALVPEPPTAVVSPELSPQGARADTAPPPRRVNWSWVAAGVVLGFALLSAGAWRMGKARASSARIHAVAVLPMSGEGMNDEALLGMTDAMIGYLGNLVAVRPMSSVLRYSAGPMDVQAAGREQGADAVVTSRTQGTGSNASLKVSLLRTSDGKLLWSKTYADSADHLAAMQSAADRDLAAELRPMVADPGAKVPPTPQTSVTPAAYQLYLRGRYFWNRRTEDGLRKSIDAFRQSIQADPNYAPAYAGLADSYALLASFSVESGRTANPDARAAALSAIQLDPTLAEPHASLGMIYFFTDWNGPAAEGEFARAITLNPNYATAHHWYALDLAAMGRFPQALYEIRRAQELDPLSLIISTNVGWIEYLNRQNDKAVGEFRKVLELDPSFVRARTRLGIAELQAGDLDGATADLEVAAKASGDPYVSGLLGEALGRGGHTAAAEKILHELQAKAGTKYVPPFALALVELGLVRKQEALTALAQAADDRSTSMVYAKIDPSLDALRGDPQFQAIVAGMRF